MRRYPQISAVFALSILLTGLVLPATAWAVIIAGESSAQFVAPADDPGWNNVATMSDGTAVYLGNGWMITANHVPDGTVTFSDGRTFSVATGSDTLLSNPDGSGTTGSPDLRMFRLTTNPNLPALTVSSTTPPGGAQVTMIGDGEQKLPTLQSWLVRDTASGTTWNTVPLRSANASGFILGGSHQLAWGINTVQPTLVAIGATDPSTGLNATIAFSTQFNSFTGAFEAQATPGDSGGAVFEKVGSQWQLVGIIDATLPGPNQPSGTAVFSNSTFAADLAAYQSQITSIMNTPISPWQNPANVFDVNHSGNVSAQDALLIINELQRFGGSSHTLTGTPGPGDFFYDVNGDGVVDPRDLLAVIDDLLETSANPSLAAAPAVTLVPEPSTAVMAVSALLSAGLVRRLRRRSRQLA